MRPIKLICLVFLSSCATKYIVPSNRFITPESQGGVFRGQFEVQNTSGNQLTIDTRNNSVNEGVIYESIPRTGFLLSNSLLEQFDLFWSHIGGSNSLVGGKFQFLGAPRSANGAGHKMSIAAALGGNEHETDDRSIEFSLSAREFLFLYGYRFTENILTYSSFSYATYEFSGTLRSPNRPALIGARPSYLTTLRSLSGGVELSYLAVFGKLEFTYQQILTEKTKDHENFSTGISFGIFW